MAEEKRLEFLITEFNSDEKRGKFNLDKAGKIAILTAALIRDNLLSKLSPHTKKDALVISEKYVKHFADSW